MVDTSSFIELNKIYPKRISHFKSIWMLLEDLIKKDRLITHEYVIKELQEKDDEIYDWVRKWKNKKRNFVKKVSESQISHVSEIVNKYPKIAEVKDKNSPFHADPFIIALAIEEKEKTILKPMKILIVCEEKFYSSKPIEQNKVGIPRIAREYGIETIELLDLLSEEDVGES